MYPQSSHAYAWLCCSDMLPLRGEQQATEVSNYPLAKSICFVYELFE